jgi:hypothetical protein
VLVLHFSLHFFTFHSSQRASLARMKNEKHAMNNAKWFARRRITG